jgi:hypothetical protein
MPRYMFKIRAEDPQSARGVSFKMVSLTVGMEVGSADHSEIRDLTSTTGDKQWEAHSER